MTIMMIYITPCACMQGSKVRLAFKKIQCCVDTLTQPIPALVVWLGSPPSAVQLHLQVKYHEVYTVEMVN